MNLRQLSLYSLVGQNFQLVIIWLVYWIIRVNSNVTNYYTLNLTNISLAINLSISFHKNVLMLNVQCNIRKINCICLRSTYTGFRYLIPLKQKPYSTFFHAFDILFYILRKDTPWQKLQSVSDLSPQKHQESYNARFQTSAAKWIRTAFFWAIAQRVVVIFFQTFRDKLSVTTPWLLDPWKWDR